MMATRRSACGLSINVWNAGNSWFWLVVYSDRHSAATGAARTEGEAAREAYAAIQPLLEFGCDCGIGRCSAAFEKSEWSTQYAPNTLSISE